MRIKKEKAREHERQVWNLRVNKMYKQEQIAEALGISQAAVSKILTRVEERYKQENLEKIDHVKNVQIAQLETAAYEAWQAWHESNDAKHMQVFLKAKEDIRKILGADAPQKLQHSGDENADAIKVDITTTRDRFLDKLTRLAEQGKSDPATS